MADYTLQDAMELALSTEGIDGVVLDPWSHSATLDGALLNGLLHAGHTPEAVSYTHLTLPTIRLV